MVTQICMSRLELITKEKMDDYCNGKMFEKESVNDDLESFFQDLRLGEKPEPMVRTYFLPKLTENKVELVERKDNNFMHTFMRDMRADVSKAEMELSESDSKFVRALGWRETYTLQKRSKLFKLLTCSTSLSE